MDFDKIFRIHKIRAGVVFMYLFQNTWPGSGPCLAETVQRGCRERLLVFFCNGWKEQGARPAGQRLSRVRADRGTRSCLDWLSRTRNWKEMGKKSDYTFWKTSFTIYMYILFSLYFSLNKINLQIVLMVHFNEVLFLLIIPKKIPHTGDTESLDRCGS